MKMLMITLMIFYFWGCISFNKVDNFKDCLDETGISIIFSYQNSLRSDHIFDIYDSTISLPLGCIYHHRSIEIDHYNYIYFLNEINRIKSLDDNKSDFSIKFMIFEKGKPYEIFQIKSINQILEYIRISDSLFGKRNFMPDRFRNLKPK